MTAVNIDLVDGESREQRKLQARISVMHNRDGLKTGLIILLHDITGERELDRMKDEFISTAAHELRTPLTAVMGFSELLLQKGAVAPEQREECLGYIHRNAEILQKIIDNLFVLSLFQKRKTVPMDVKPFDLSTKLEELIEHYQAHSAQHQFHLSLPPAMPLMVIDWDKVMQVMENLLSNAVKFSPEGGRIKVEGFLEQGLLKLIVSDQGIGMTKDQLAKIFDKFYRADASNTAGPGLGLGMALAKNIVEAHGGTIHATSRLGQGTSVSFSLPLSSVKSQES
jgi:signal transduction histidine kinase